MSQAELSPPVVQRFIGLRMTDGIRRLNLGAYFLACALTICLLSFVNQIQPFLLTNFLGIPVAEQGVVTGGLTFWEELVGLFAVALGGVLSDKLGRRPVFALGFLILGLGFFLFPFAGSLRMLLGFKVLFSVGSVLTVGMMSAVVADYVINRDRGKANGYGGIMNGMGAIFAVFVLVQIPGWLIEGGMGVREAGRITYWIAAGLAGLSALVMWLGLKAGRHDESLDEPSFRQLLRDGIAATRDPGVALAYGGSFVARGHLLVMGSFLALWINKAGTVQGIAPGEITAQLGIIIGISQSVALFGAPIYGWLSDRTNRVVAVIVSNVVAVLGFGGLYFVDDPFSGMMIGMASLAALGQIGSIITTQVLIQQQAPLAVRGSVIGFWGLCGSAGILLTTSLGGLLFDAWAEAGPFVMMAGFSLLLILWALAVIGRVKPPIELLSG